MSTVVAVVVRSMMMMVIMVKIMMKFEVYTAVKIKNMIFRAVTRCSLVGRYQHFRETKMSPSAWIKGDPLNLNIDAVASSKTSAHIYQTTQHNE